MRFDDNIGLDTSQISDSRGLGFAGPLVGGGGIIGLVLYLVASFAGVDMSAVAPTQVNSPTQSYDNTELAARCQTGADANKDPDCRIVGVVNSVQRYWQTALPGYRQAKTQFFTGGVNTACGGATSAVGPFYCPADRTIYIDLGFYDQLRQQFGATGGPFAESYVIAHEYGHHVQNITGVFEKRNSGKQTGPTGTSVRMELQADCFAGVWANNAVRTGFIVELTEADIKDGLNAASVIGDDRIQEQARGNVDKESWTHGSSDQRQRWFLNGYQQGNPNSCDTFATNRL